MAKDTVRLLISCKDARGIIAAVAGFIAQHDGNILEADQHSARESGLFFMRVEIEMEGFGLTKSTFAHAWAPVAQRFGMQWQTCWGNETKRMAVLVSKAGHCLSDLLWRWKTGELAVEIPMVLGNHRDLEGDVAAFGIPFHYRPVSSDSKAEQEARVLDLLRGADVDFIVLARYMQILSKQFIDQYPQRIINIHHSFLPAFAGSKPYHHAFQRGVKIIGATSHYVTEALDSGPIIAQSTLPVGHRDSVEDMIRKGRDLERVVLATAVRLHVEDKILSSENKTVVFD